MNKAIEDAIRFISESLKLDSNADKSALVNKACVKFDLNPTQTQFLIEKYVQNN